MKIMSPVYCCTECKKIVSTLPELLFVEENSTKGFCSEECIEFFYSSLLKYYEEVLYKLRTKLDLQNESIHFELSEHDLIEEVIRAPSEIWCTQNELHEEVFSYIKHFNQASVIVLCTVLNTEPSFIFLSTKTCSQKLISEFRFGERLVTTTEASAEEMILDLESKKSYLIADLLSKRLDHDIPFEDFPTYEYCLDSTLEAPDEVFEFKDREGDLLQTSIKSFSNKSKNFFYIIISFNNMNVLSFPTEDMNLYAEFRMGKQVSSNLKN